MEMLLYQSTQFRDVKKILDRAHGFAGLLTAGGIEASRLDVPFVCDQKVLSRYDDACSDVRRILTMQLGLTLPKGFSIPLEAYARDLPVSLKQQVEIVKVLYKGAEIIILDEPTSVLTPQGIEGLFQALRHLKNMGKTIILIDALAGILQINGKDYAGTLNRILN